MNKRAKALMVVGTGSDVGKSIVTTAICRYFSQKGLNVAPFKAQNMALNSYVTIDGKEIGRAQGLQAEAANVAASAYMNPVLLKPTKKNTSQVVVLGKPEAEMDFKEYRETKYDYLKGVILDSLDKLKSENDVIVIEGAGSPVEMNLKSRDIVNMQVAEWADADVFLVADVDRGGVFAQVVGTLALLREDELARVKGIIINKFRGNLELFESGIDWIEDYTGVPVISVLPHIVLPEWEEEDSVALSKPKIKKATADLDIVVIQTPYISNYTDFTSLYLEADVHIRYVKDVKDFGEPHAIVLPGTKNTMEDLLFLRNSGLEDKIRDYVKNGGELIGICGGYQMLSQMLYNPDLVESIYPELKGLGLLPINTTFFPEKRTERVVGKDVLTSNEVYGYEIHMGKVDWLNDQQYMFELEDGVFEGARNTEYSVWGTFIHGVFDSDSFRHPWLDNLREKYGLKAITERVNYSENKEQMFLKLEDWINKNLSEKGSTYFENFLKNVKK